MRFPLRPLIFSAVAAWCALPCARAGWSGGFDMEPDSGVDIGVDMAYESFPMAGYVPCRVSIKNGSDTAQTWNFSFITRTGDSGRPSEEVLEREFRVPAGESGSFDVLMPVCPSHQNDGYVASPSIMATGYGLRSPQISLPNAGRGGKTETAFVIMSPGLATRSWKLLSTELDKRWKQTLVGSEMGIGMLSEDWRGLLGVGGFFIGANEFSGLSPGQRHAVRAWVAQGGTLILCGDGEVRDFENVGAQGGEYGLGDVKRLAWDGVSELPIAEATEFVRGLNDMLGDRLKDPSPPWNYATSLGVASRNVSFLAVFITLFAVIVGPLNLFWFAGSGRRHRLFWTTPLISVGASVLLGAVILLQDGFGGRGVRMTLRYLLPQDKQVLVMQEQASRTGLLLSRSFAGSPDIFLAPLTTPHSIGGQRSSRTYTLDPRGFGGDWFVSRSTQGQFIEAMVPSREAVEMVGMQDGAPVVRSSIPVMLAEFYFIDEKGAHWFASNLRTGESMKLVSTDKANPMQAVKRSSGPMLGRAFEAIGNKNGYFYAIAAKPVCIETLPSIRWSDEKTIYIGPVVATP
ncbi:MAG: hypothetical protein ACREKL_01905 [Chthoniobacterales bacterium]